MNLTELIRLNNHLEELTMQDLRRESSNRFELIIDRVDVPHVGIDSGFQQRLKEKNHTLQSMFVGIDEELTDLKSEVQQLIAEQGQAWLHRNYTEYEKFLETNYAQTEEYLRLHRNKLFRRDTDTESVLKSRVANYCDWKHPSMVIHPMLETFIHEMTASDPLYLVDESHYLLEPTLEQFNTVYQNRLRPYVIKESFNHPILNRLPDQQIGFCLVYNYLDYRPFELVKIYLEEIYQKLLPGGVLAMTFNDCDRHQAMQAVEQGITGYTPGSLVRGWANYLGFEEIFCHRTGSPSVWIEFRKSGQLTSLRGGQSLAKILPKPIPKITSEPVPEPIVEFTMDELREKVLALNQYDPSQVRYGFTELKLKAILKAQSKEN